MMTPKQQQFAREYLIDLNATQVAIRAGYSRRSAMQMGEENLRKPESACEIQRAMAARSRRTEITADRVLEEVARLAFLDIAGAFNVDGSLKSLHDMDVATRAAIASLEVIETHGEDGRVTGRIKKLRLADKTANLTLLMRHLGMLNDKLKVGGDPENPLTLLL